jgi:sulfide:quinone oxidoreductase
MSAHAYVGESGLAHAEGPHKGWLKTDMHTLQHLEYPNIFGIGDVTGIPNAKTGAAVRKQAPLMVANLLTVMAGQKAVEKYDGYSSCPLVTGKHSVILAEFGYDGKLLPSFPVDPTKERYSMWILKRYLLPEMYWHGMLKGRA